MKNLPLVPDDLWEAIESLLPKEPPKPKGGRPRVPDRAALGGIIFVLRTGCPWRLLPRELGCGSGVTCWRRLRDWQEAGVWERLHTRLLNWLGDEAAIDWSRASLDSVSVRAKRGANRPAPTRPTAARPAPSTTWSSTATASRLPSACRPPTSTMRLNCCPSSMRSRPSSVRGDVQAVPESARPSCTATRPTMRPPCGVRSVLVASPHDWHGVGSNRASAWGGTAGWWSAALPGC
jgi:transposase